MCLALFLKLHLAVLASVNTKPHGRKHRERERQRQRQRQRQTDTDTHTHTDTDTHRRANSLLSLSQTPPPPPPPLPVLLSVLSVLLQTWITARRCGPPTSKRVSFSARLWTLAQTHSLCSLPMVARLSRPHTTQFILLRMRTPRIRMTTVSWQLRSPLFLCVFQSFVCWPVSS